jgi:hypothetical protein
LTTAAPEPATRRPIAAAVTMSGAQRSRHVVGAAREVVGLQPAAGA